MKYDTQAIADRVLAGLYKTSGLNGPDWNYDGRTFRLRTSRGPDGIWYVWMHPRLDRPLAGLEYEIRGERLDRYPHRTRRAAVESAARMVPYMLDPK